MSEELAGKVALITGGASGIGEACARTFAREGASVVVTDIQDEKGAAVAGEIGGLYLHQDVREEHRWVEIVAAVRDRFGRLDVLVNNAGVVLGQSIETSELDDWNRVIGINLTGTMLGCKHAIAAMKENPGGPSGSIVNISSITGFIGLPGGVAYTASKGGVRLLSKSVAVHCAREYRTIRCNSLHPGTIDTPIHHGHWEASGDVAAARAAFDRLQPIGRMASAAEIADGALFLASDRSTYVTGSELLIDGGWLAAGGIF